MRPELNDKDIPDLKDYQTSPTEPVEVPALTTFLCAASGPTLLAPTATRAVFKPGLEASSSHLVLYIHSTPPTMGFWNDGIRDRSRSRSPSRKAYYASRPSYSRSASSFFSSFGGGSSSRGHHHSRARPRSGFINRIRRFLREIYSYMRRHPLKVFLLVIMPLITGGALAKLLAQVGIRLPPGLHRMMGGTTRQTTERYYSRGGARDFEGGTSLPGMSSGVGDSISSLMGIAKMFI